MSGSSRDCQSWSNSAGTQHASACSGLIVPTRGPETMNGETLKRRVIIMNPQGFHMRPQSQFVQCANRFTSAVTVARGDQRVNGKSQWDLMLLAAEQGTELLLEVSGPDAPAAIEELAEILAAPSADDVPERPLPKKG